MVYNDPVASIRAVELSPDRAADLSSAAAIMENISR
jgi:hypothetical protein